VRWTISFVLVLVMLLASYHATHLAEFVADHEGVTAPLGAQQDNHPAGEHLTPAEWLAYLQTQDEAAALLFELGVTWGDDLALLKPREAVRIAKVLPPIKVSLVPLACHPRPAPSSVIKARP